MLNKEVKVILDLVRTKAGEAHPKRLLKFFRLYGLSNNWVNDFQESFGISREDFYKEWWAYLGIPQSDWPDLQPPTPPERY